MIIQHNMQAMNANRMLGITTGQQAKSTEKLSSGYRINRAADDAAGLTISEKMRKQIRGLDQASTNAQDGISCVQTAEGALTEVHSMLQRMNELAVQAANGTMSVDDRQAVQDEIDQLVTEIDRVSETTKFNEIYLLKGDGTETKTKEVVTTPLSAKYANDIEKTVVAKNGATWTADKYYEAGEADSIADLDALKALYEINDDGKIVLKDEKAIYDKPANTTNEYGAQVTPVDAEELANQFLSVQSNALYDTTSNTEVSAEDLVNYFNSDGTYKGGLSAYKTDGSGLAEVGAEQIDDFVTVTKEVTEEQEYEAPKALQFNLHVGSESAQANKIGVAIESMSAEGIGVDVLKGDGLMTEKSATEAIDVIAEAIARVSEQRSALGATQNRLEHTIANLDNVVENTTAAESRIRDVDMAEEMVNYSKNNILAQAGQSMLAQANQATQGVLSLLG